MHPLVPSVDQRAEIADNMRSVHSSSPLYDYEQTRSMHGSKTLPCSTSSSVERTRLSYKSSRGRPRADVVSSLILSGSEMKGRIRCDICNRVFPREKSLQAHMRTHTGERPYVCDFPGCTRAFCQSGQLKTHQRLHTGEKPFACCVDGCSSRFTHANRHCSLHPYAGLRRVETRVTGPEGFWDDGEDHAAIREWLNKQAEMKQARSSPTGKSSPRKLKRTHSADVTSDDDINDNVSSSQSSRTSHSDVSQEDDIIVGTTSCSSSDIIGGESDVNHTGSDVIGGGSNIIGGGSDNVIGGRSDVTNDGRAKVTNTTSSPIRDDQQDKWMGALALMELASGFHNR